MGTRAGVSDATVLAATGRDWAGWIAALDRAGAAKLAHRDIAKLIHDRFALASGWWCQMVTVGYEQAKGLRAMYEKSDGFSAGASKTIAAPVGAVFAAWSDARKRKPWLPDAITVRKATAGKSMRINWGDGTNVEVHFVPKGDAKTQVAVQHGKLPDAKAVAAVKALWKDALDRLAARLAR